MSGRDGGGTRGGEFVPSAGVIAEAPAKVNLHLGVGRLRPDGYHAVETVLQAIDLTDSITIRPSSVFRFSCHPDLEISLKQNLAWRAAMLYAQQLGRVPLVEIELRKAIPAGAGLGGGSSDAAAVIAGLSALWSAEAESAGDLEGRPPVAGDRLALEVAAGIGADVPFFLGGGTALLAGRGDELVRTIPAPHLDIVLVKPAQPVRTAAAYVEFDYAPVPARKPEPLISACESGDVTRVAAALANNMERAAVTLVSEVADTLAWVRGAEGVLGAAVAGSGSAVFGICVDRQTAEDVASEARLFGWWSVAARSRDCGVSVRPLEEAS